MEVNRIRFAHDVMEVAFIRIPYEFHHTPVKVGGIGKKQNLQLWQPDGLVHAAEVAHLARGKVRGGCGKQCAVCQGYQQGVPASRVPILLVRRRSAAL